MVNMKKVEKNTIEIIAIIVFVFRKYKGIRWGALSLCLCSVVILCIPSKENEEVTVLGKSESSQNSVLSVSEFNSKMDKLISESLISIPMDGKTLPNVEDKSFAEKGEKLESSSSEENVVTVYLSGEEFSKYEVTIKVSIPENENCTLDEITFEVVSVKAEISDERMSQLPSKMQKSILKEAEKLQENFKSQLKEDGVKCDVLSLIEQE